MEGRTQFTFYESFAKAVSRIRKDADRAKAYDAIVNYALYGKEPDLDAMPETAAIAFDLIRPNLDASRRKAESGKAGGSVKQNGSKTEAKPKEAAREKEDEKEKENEVEKEKEDECPSPTPSSASMEADPDVAAVVGYYLNRVNPNASSSSLQEIVGYAKALGREVCIRAIEIAIDERKQSWSYIRAILQRWSQEGVKCLADVERLESLHEAGKNIRPDATKPQKRTPAERAAQQQKDRERAALDREQMLKELRRLREEDGEA